MVLRWYFQIIMHTICNQAIFTVIMLNVLRYISRNRMTHYHLQ